MLSALMTRVGLNRQGQIEPPIPEDRAKGQRRKAGLVIVDPSLDGFLGHHYEYDASTAAAATAAGLDPVILSRLLVADAIADDPLIVPSFRLNMWAKSPDEINFSDPDLMACNRWFHVDLMRAVRGLDLAPGAIVFGHMITSKQLLGWSWFIERHALPNGLRVVLLLRYEPSLYTGIVAAKAFRNLERLSASGMVRLASDSTRLAAGYAALTSLPIEIVAIPHAKPPCKSPTAPKSALLPAHGLDGLRQVCFATLGNPRVDKGFLDVLAAVTIIAASPDAKRFRYVIQANDPGYGIEPTLGTFIDHAPDGTCFITSLMDPETYFATLFSADIVVLPYWVSVYEGRTSGVFVEAVSAGKVVICSAGTWMADELHSWGAGVICEERNPQSLAAAMRRCLCEFEALSGRAEHAAEAYRARHNAARLVQDLVEGANDVVRSTRL